MTETIVSMSDVSKEYTSGTKALDNVSLTIEPGEFVYIVGQSGSGKSTLMRLLYREEKSTAGDIEVVGHDVDSLKDKDVYQLRRDIGIVFQDYKLLKNKTVRENVAYAMEAVGIFGEGVNERVEEVLKFVGLEDKLDQFPSKLSGGEQQRVAIARAIVNHPDLILADEPTGNLDPDTTWDIMKLLERINLMGTTVVMVTHNNLVVDTLKHRVITLENGKLISDEPDGEGL